MPNQRAYTKAFACMECFRCTAEMCPDNLNPMLINELIKGEYISKGLGKIEPMGDAMGTGYHPSGLFQAFRFRGRITAKSPIPSNKRQARYVFFPGCNVYFQPEKILNALDIMDAVGDDYAFLPGLAYCCGDSLFFLGDIDEGSRRSWKTLVAAHLRL